MLLLFNFDNFSNKLQKDYEDFLTFIEASKSQIWDFLEAQKNSTMNPMQLFESSITDYSKLGKKNSIFKIYEINKISFCADQKYWLPPANTLKRSWKLHFKD